MLDDFDFLPSSDGVVPIDLIKVFLKDPSLSRLVKYLNYMNIYTTQSTHYIKYLSLFGNYNLPS